MKSISQLMMMFIVVAIFASCKKEDTKPKPIASLNITNAVVSGTTAKFGNSATTISNNNYAQFGLRAGSNNIYIYPTTDSLHPYYNNMLNANSGDIYSIFLAGTLTQVDTLLVKDNIPYHADSTAGIRFINLSPNTSSKAINITLSASNTVNEVSNLAYKQYTSFKNYPGLYNSAYAFEIRNDTSAAPHAPLATFAFTTSTVPRFANITLVIRQNGTGVSVFRVNNDR